MRQSFTYQDQNDSTYVCDINITVHNIKACWDYWVQEKKFHWCSEIDRCDQVKVYGGVIARNHELVRVEDYVAFIHEEYDKVS